MVAPPDTGVVQDAPSGESAPANGSIAASDVVVNVAGSVIVLGTLNGDVDLGKGTLSSAGGGDLLLAAFDPARAAVWNRRFGDAQAQGGGSLALDGAGNIAVATTFRGEIDFGMGALASAGGGDVGVCKLDADGRALWSKRFGDVNGQSAIDVAVDSSGRVVVAAASDLPFDLGGGTAPGTSGGSSLAVLDPASGDVIWSKAWPGVSVVDLAVQSSGDVVVAGSFTEPIDLGGGTHPNAGHTDIFVAAFSATGSYRWSRLFGGSGSELVAALDVDPSGNLILTGSFNDTVTFGGQALVSVMSPNRSVKSRDMFIAKLDAAGAHVWSRQLGEPDEAQWGVGIGSDRLGNVLVSGGFAGSIDLGGGPLAPADGPAFVLKLDPAGSSLWSRQLAAPGVSLRASPSDRVLVAGDFPITASFPSATATFVGGSKVFLIEYAP